MKKASESFSTLSQVMLPGDTNPTGTVHGGEIMKIMDTCGGVAANRHSRSAVATVRVDELVFYKPIFVSELVICDARLVFTGKTSMEVEVTVRAENLRNEEPERIAIKAYFTYIAIDESHKPCAVPQLEPVTDEEKVVFEERKKKYMERKKALKS